MWDDQSRAANAGDASNDHRKDENEDLIVFLDPSASSEEIDGLINLISKMKNVNAVAVARRSALVSHG